MIKSDSQLQRDVIEELRWDPSIGRLEIGVASKDGVITVSGNVDSFSRKLSVVKAAERVSGVKAVAALACVWPSSRGVVEAINRPVACLLPTAAAHRPQRWDPRALAWRKFV